MGRLHAAGKLLESGVDSARSGFAAFCSPGAYRFKRSIYSGASRGALPGCAGASPATAHGDGLSQRRRIGNLLGRRFLGRMCSPLCRRRIPSVAIPCNPFFPGMAWGMDWSGKGIGAGICCHAEHRKSDFRPGCVRNRRTWLLRTLPFSGNRRPAGDDGGYGADSASLYPRLSAFPQRPDALFGCDPESAMVADRPSPDSP